MGIWLLGPGSSQWGTTGGRGYASGLRFPLGPGQDSDSFPLLFVLFLLSLTGLLLYSGKVAALSGLRRGIVLFSELMPRARWGEVTVQVYFPEPQ